MGYFETFGSEHKVFECPTRRAAGGTKGTSGSAAPRGHLVFKNNFFDLIKNNTKLDMTGIATQKVHLSYPKP